MRKKRDVKYVTIKDVAKDADVSIATVSRVLNNGIVKNERKKRVLDAINKLNYTPNNSARNLASVTKTKKISIVLPTQKSVYIDIIQGFREGLELYKYEESIEVYYDDFERYEYICDKIERSSEVKSVVQLGKEIPILHKELTTLYDEKIIFSVDDKYKDKKIGLIIKSDKYLETVIQNLFFANNDIRIANEKNYDEFDCFVTESVDQAIGLINKEVTKDIYILEKADEVHKLFNNIKHLNFDFYMLGITLARTAIKKVENEEVKKINFLIN